MKMTFSDHSRQRGVALVITLLCLVLLVILAVGFLSNVATNRVSSGTEHGIALTQSLSESVVELVKAQILEGARSQSPAGADLAWASQPGMIRTFEVGGTPGTFYKLYSATEMVKAGSVFSLNDDVPTAVENQAVWADLNRPVLDADGVTLRYPIVDPGAVGKVEGFTCNATSAWGYAGGTASVINNPAPMPVRWLYVLQNGSMVPAAASGNGTATVAGATTVNPIIGRVAFWTDDDTCKVNLNTASEGTFWDIPRADTATERMFSSLQPVKNEFQRYPGHPAMTSLSSVFGYWLPPPDPVTSGNYPLLSKYYQLAPRINDTVSPNTGGAVAGTRAKTANLNAARANIAPDADRLYASTDEFVFSALGGAPSMPSLRTINDSALTNQVSEMTRFFTTTDSRSPDVNPFGQPRITIWPLRPGLTTASQTADQWTPQDQLINFCSIIGGNRYAFTRNDPNSATADYMGQPRNQTLFTYLKDATSRPIPGFPNQTFAGKYGSDERDQILANIFDYCRVGAPVYSSLNVNPPDPRNFTRPNIGQYMVTPISIGTKKGLGSFKTIQELAVVFYAYDEFKDAGGTVQPTAQRRLMRAVVLPNLFFPHQGYTDYSDFRIEISGLSAATITNSSNATLSLGFVDGLNNWLSGATNQQGAGFYGGGYGFTPMLATIRGGPGKNLYGSSDILTFYQYTPKYLGRTDECLQYPFFSEPIEIPLTSSGNFTFSGFPNLQVKIKALVNPDDFNQGEQVVQTVNIAFPGGTIPYPIPTTQQRPPGNMPDPASQTWVGNALPLANDPTKILTNPDKRPTLDAVSTKLDSFNARIYSGACNNWTSQIFQPGDVVRSVVIDPSGPAKGDPRLVAGLKTVPNSYFAPPNAGSGSFQHGVRTSRPLIETGATVSGELVAGIAGYQAAAKPFVPPGLVAATMDNGNPGDWETGVANFPDGPSIGLADSSGSQAASHFSPLWGGIILDEAFYSPNRSMPSPVVFGSLPTGIQQGKPWQSLLFSPISAADMAGGAHPGSVNPPDHLLLEFFKMPIVEPYAISDPFSTSGKININYQMMPFSHIERKTGLHALLKSARLAAIPDGAAGSYKTGTYANLSGATLSTVDGPPAAGEYRLKINPTETLKGFDNKVFATGNIFRTASQLCEMPLYPAGVSFDASQSNIRTFWSTHRLTGDNLREAPYRDLYGRVTTQSNTYTVHYIVQALKKSPTGAANVWTEGTDKVIGEYRGSTSIERYIDPEDVRLKTSPPDFATAPTSSSANRLDSLYRIRTLGSRRFAP